MNGRGLRPVAGQWEVDRERTKRMMYRKKPVEIEARRVPSATGDITAYLDECVELAEWCGGTSYMMTEPGEWAWDWRPNDPERGFGSRPQPLVEGPYIQIPTLEGDHAALPGDWIIRGVKGEFYPIKDSIFRETYDAVEETARRRL